MVLAPLLTLSLARAADPAVDAPQTFALVVGSNRPGPGQQALHFAQDDAARIASVLEDVGGVDPSRLTVLEDPSADELFDAIDAVRSALAVDSGATELVFYYSGHARAGALDLGQEAVPLDALRARLQGAGAHLTVVVLDACQSGAISDVKGAESAADFSTASVGSLASAGIAIIASSTDTELSQESRAIGGSFFTLDLATGLRGPADANRDGNVTLAEAYQYAYHHTLVDTAATAVGAQHPTLETDLRGQGDLVLSRPADASAKLGFPAELSADVVVVRASPESVAAEVHKAAGDAFELALVPGEYRAIVRSQGSAVACAVTLAESTTTPLVVAGCPVVALEATAPKGWEDSVTLRKPPAETLFFELAGGALSRRDDLYTDRLDDFGFDSVRLGSLSTAWTLSGAWTPTRHLALVTSAGKLENRRLSRDLAIGGEAAATDTFSWSTQFVELAPRATLPMFDASFVAYAQVGAGVAWSVSHYVSTAGDDRQTFAGPELSVAGGLQEMPVVRDWRHFGFYQQLAWSTAPALRNLIGDTHDDGGISVLIGLRAGY